MPPCCTPGHCPTPTGLSHRPLPSPPSVRFSRRASCSRDDLLAARRHVAIAPSAATRDVLFCVCVPGADVDLLVSSPSCTSVLTCGRLVGTSCSPDVCSAMRDKCHHPEQRPITVGLLACSIVPGPHTAWLHCLLAHPAASSFSCSVHCQ